MSQPREYVCWDEAQLHPVIQFRAFNAQTAAGLYSEDVSIVKDAKVCVVAKDDILVFKNKLTMQQVRNGTT